MKRLFLAVVLVLSSVCLLSACKTDKGSREFLPGKGWRPVR
jgi:hypothetical protein